MVVAVNAIYCNHVAVNAIYCNAKRWYEMFSKLIYTEPLVLYLKRFIMFVNFLDDKFHCIEYFHVFDILCRDNRYVNTNIAFFGFTIVFKNDFLMFLVFK